LPANGAADLAVLAPSRRELADERWLPRACAEASRRLGPGGVASALVPRRRRRAARTALRRLGLVVDAPLAVFSQAAEPRYLVPVRDGAWRYMLCRRIGARPWTRRALRGAQRLPLGESLLAAALPAVAILARRGDAGPLGGWVEALTGASRATADVAVATSWRGSHGPVVVYCFSSAEEEPWGVAKVGMTSDREAGLLDDLGDGARTAGAQVPRLLGQGMLGSVPVLVETPLDGRPAAGLLMRSPGRFGHVVDGLTGWLERWNRTTATRAVEPRRWLEHEILAPAADLAEELPDVGAYWDWLVQRCDAAADLRLVSSHNDLTMWNVLLAEPAGIGVLDWAEASAAALPLTDFFYAVADAAAACNRYRSRVDAVRSCFAPGGSHAVRVAALEERLRRALAVTPQARELAFHACWLHHARNERRTAVASDRPFLEVVRWLARRVDGAA
jgi:hypothetical protein